VPLGEVPAHLREIDAELSLCAISPSRQMKPVFLTMRTSFSSPVTGFVSGVIWFSVTPSIATRDRFPSTMMSIIARSTAVVSSRVELKIS
jgi:hypothetical protein